MVRYYIVYTGMTKEVRVIGYGIFELALPIKTETDIDLLTEAIIEDYYDKNGKAISNLIITFIFPLPSP